MIIHWLSGNASLCKKRPICLLPIGGRRAVVFRQLRWGKVEHTQVRVLLIHAEEAVVLKKTKQKVMRENKQFILLVPPQTTNLAPNHSGTHEHFHR